MEALRLVLYQSSANYRKEETVDNKMTYPLPPPSTVIGAIHNACGYREYHPMDVSIQGRFESMHKKAYQDHCFLNSTQDDRGTLVKMRNPSMLSTAFDKVASAKKPQGNSFRNRVTIEVHSEELIQEYIGLKKLNEELQEYKNQKLKPFLTKCKKRKENLAAKRKKLDPDSQQYKNIVSREKEIKQYEKQVKAAVKEYEEEYYSRPISHYHTLTTSLKFYEILNNIELVIHIRADHQVLKDIYDNIYNLKAIGRSEDAVQVQEAELVDLTEDHQGYVESKYSAYINYEDIAARNIYGSNVKAGRSVNGTKFLMNKVYTIVDGKREFEKKWLFYLSEYGIDGTSENVFLDFNQDEAYIINFI